MRSTLLLVAALTAGCSGSPTAPAPTPTPVTPPVALTLAATVMSTNGHQPLGGLTASLNSVQATTDGAGQATLTVPTPGTFALALTGATIVPRQLSIAVMAPRAISVDAIALGGGFDLAFYRQFARNGLDGPTLQPLRRWTRNPNVFIQTTTLVNAATLDMVERTIRDAVPRWTAGQFSVASVERGDGDPHAHEFDWLTIGWEAGNTGWCGLATVGGNVITLSPQTPNCGCDGYGIRPTTVRHETGHAMGYWHTEGTNDVMYVVSNVCDKPLSAREVYHTALAYSRPVGNVDPDVDPSGVVNLAPMRVP